MASSVAPGAARAGPLVQRAGEVRAQLDAFRGPGTWVDIYDPGVLRAPERSAALMAANGVKTLFLETANYRQGPDVDIVNPRAIGRLVDAAHRAGIRVVAWYLPSLANLARDLRRSLAAIRFTAPSGAHFDSFALDIESTVIPGVRLRNRALLELSRRLRLAVGRSYALGAIVPDQRSTAVSPGLWPGFPYRAAARLYDVFMPMSYSSHRGRGARFVYRYTRANIDFVRRRIGKRSFPVHPIGGLAHRLGPAEARSVVKAAFDRGSLGVSFYKFSISGREEWAALRRRGR